MEQRVWRRGPLNCEPLDLASLEGYPLGMELLGGLTECTFLPQKTSREFTLTPELHLKDRGKVLCDVYFSPGLETYFAEI